MVVNEYFVVLKIYFQKFWCPFINHNLFGEIVKNRIDRKELTKQHVQHKKVSKLGNNIEILLYYFGQLSADAIFWK